MSHDFGDIVLVRFPFTDQRGAKRRPAVVISTSEYHHSRPDVILAAVTSRLPNSQHELDLPIRHWDVAGLAKASAVKPIVFTAERASMTREIPAQARIGNFLPMSKAFSDGHDWACLPQWVHDLPTQSYRCRRRIWLFPRGFSMRSPSIPVRLG